MKAQQLRITEQQLDLFCAYLPGQEAPKPSELVCKLCGNPTVFVSQVCRHCQMELEAPTCPFCAGGQAHVPHIHHALASHEVDPRPDCAYDLERWTCSCGTKSGFWAAPTTAADRWALHLAGKIK